VHRTHRSLTLAAVAATAMLATAAHAADSFTDAWDQSQGSTVLSTSPLHPAGLAAGMFGGDAGPLSPFSAERFNTLFADLQPAGTVSGITWQTADPITLTGFHLRSIKDGTSDGRSFSSFSLFALLDGAFQTLSLIDANLLYTEAGVLDITMQFAPVTAQVFRAEFTQRSNLFGQSGVRVEELDAITAAVPEPGTWALMLAGGALLLARQRRQRGEPAPR